MADIKPGERITVAAVVESEGHDDRHVIVRIGGRPVQVPVPVTTPDDRWNRLREHIREERATLDDAAAEHSEYGRDDQSERCYEQVRLLDRLLATMDRMEAGQ